MRAFITGVTGQDGYYLSQLLLLKGYEVYGLVRRTAQGHEIPPGIKVLEGDVCDAASVVRAMASCRPHEVYNLAAMSHVGQSFNAPSETFRVNTLGLINVVEAARHHRSKVYQASTSEMFGNQEGPLNEQSPLQPVSPYGASKTAAHHIVSQCRSRGMFACAGILFNHESPRRGHDFVTQRIATGVARIRAGIDTTIWLGNIDARRDWGHAADYVEAMWAMLQQPRPRDFVIASGKTRSVKDVLQAAWGDGWNSIVATDLSRMRPVELHELVADPTHAREVLGWRPTITFEGMIQEMVQAAEAKLAKEGHGNHHRPDRPGHGDSGYAS